MKNFLHEFKTFAMKGNVMDLAIGVIIGAAFGKIVTSLVDNILMPIVGALLGGQNFDSYSVNIGGATLKYGMFISATIDFIIIALVLFVMVRLMNRMKKKSEASNKPEEKPADIKLLEEIRDSLRNK
ncbi:MAG: large-conductance mechanosensitive channel protein MscL [Candidatus Pacebacteria bacterium]|nr:large-conductance mechanosensitive channel protein MscL [Candidatus Paceibacterota bacterium]